MRRLPAVIGFRSVALALVAMIVAPWLSNARGSEREANWRIYRAADGLRESLTTAITISPHADHENVWVKHGEVDSISVLDGYTIHQVPAPGERNYRVYESRAGKIWSIYDQGLLEFVGEQWLRYPIPEVRREIDANPLRQLRQTTLVPAAQDRVLILLPDRLIDYRSVRREATLLRLARQTSLGRFYDMSASADGGLWLAGLTGLAHIPGQLRQLDSNTVWSEYTAPKTLGLQNFQRPFEDDEGGVVAIAESQAADRRVMVHFDGTNWLTRGVPGENLRFAWASTDPGVYWALTFNGLQRLYPDRVEPVRPGLVPSQCFDVAVEPRDVFWIATLEGLVRHAPLPWRTPEPLASLDAVVYGLAQTTNGVLWCATAKGLVSGQDGVWHTLRWPTGFDASFRARDGLFLLANGELLVEGGGEILIFDPRMARFRPLVHPEGHKLVKVLRRAPDGQVCLQTLPNDASQGGFGWELFDGRRFQPFTGATPNVQLGTELFFLEQAQNGDWWLGGSSGPAVWRDKKWQKFGLPDGYSDEGAICWLEQSDGRIWCAGLGKILEFDGKSWSVVRTGFDRVTTMTKAKDGSVWVATSSGLYRYYKESWGWVGEEEGLPSSAAYAVLEDSRRSLWVGTSRGLTQYFPAADVDPPHTLRVRTDQPENVAPEGSVVFSFEAVDRWQFTPSSRLFYSYRLDEGAWSAFGRSVSVALRVLGAGKHTFEVRAMDRNWNIEPRPVALEFRVFVPWYREARLISVAAAGLLVALFFAGLAVNRHLKLRRSYARVEKIVQERTHELERATQELVHSQKMTALGTLAAGVAHDFNNILSIIKGSVQVIENNLEDREKVRTRLGRIKTMVDQGSGIVRAMLGFGREDEKKITACDPGRIVQETMRLLGDRFLKEVRVRREVASGLPAVRGARGLMQQMLLNLILNAADALDGPGEIVLRAGPVRVLPTHLILGPAPASGYVFVAVQDTGCGIAPEVLPRIFEPFFTTKSFSSRHGTGLGLYTVYELAKELGHGLAVESAVGKGSIFTIYLPIADAAKEEDAKRA